MADVAYRAYAGPTRGVSKRFDGLRGIAVLNINTIYLMANPLTGIQSIGDLRGTVSQSAQQALRHPPLRNCCWKRPDYLCRN